MNFGLSEHQKLLNAAKVAKAVAQLTNTSTDWKYAAERYAQVDGGEVQQDYCIRMCDAMKKLEEQQ